MYHDRLTTLVLAPALALVACTTDPAAPSTTPDQAPVVSAAGGRAGSTGVIYVTGQGLYYDTFVAKDPLPMKGKFQLLADGETQFGPGDPGYLGGRWWEDLNHNGVQDPGDHYFLCPLLPPGRATP